MTITRAVSGNTAAAQELNQLIDLMEGAESIDFLLASLVATDFKVRLADSAGSRKFIIQDSAGSTIAYVDSDGNASFTSIALGSLVIPTAASPAQTADGSVVWDSDGDFLTIGDGTNRKSFQPSKQGSDLASASTLTVTDRYHRVTGAVTITAISVLPAGFEVELTFAGTPQLTNSAGLLLAGAANYTVTAEETLKFKSDGTNWREVGRKPPAAVAAGLVLAGADTTERTTVSTSAVDLCTISGLNIAADVPFEIWVPFRKTTGAAANVYLGLKLNATTVEVPRSVSASTNAAVSGLMKIHVGPREASYLRDAIMQSAASDFDFRTGICASDADMPTAAITSVIIRGQTSNASVTLAVKNVRVYTLPIA